MLFSRNLIYAISAVLIWSTVASVFKIALEYMDSFQLQLYSSLTSLVALSVIIIMQNKIQLLRASLNRKFIISSMILGLLNPFLYYLVLFKAYLLLPAQEAQALNYTWPIMIILLSIPLLEQKIKTLNFLAIIISFVGVLIISTRGDVFSLRLSNLIGVLLALSSALIWATYWIFNIRDTRDTVVKLFLNFMFGLVPILASVLLFSKISFNETLGLLGVIYIGLFEMGITFLIWLEALKSSKNIPFLSHLIYLIPFLSLIIIYFSIGEKILPSTIVGLSIIIGGIIIHSVNYQSDSG